MVDVTCRGRSYPLLRYFNFFTLITSEMIWTVGDPAELQPREGLCGGAQILHHAALTQVKLPSPFIITTKTVLRIRDVYPGSWFLPIPDPDFYPSPISNPGSRISDLGSWIPDPKQQQKRRVKKISCHPFLCSHKFHKIEHYFSAEGKNLGRFSKNYRTF